MSCCRFHGIVASILLLTLPSMTQADEYKDPTGFSFTYPENWVIVNRDTVWDAIPTHIRNRIDQSEVNIKDIRVMLIRNGQEESLEVLQVCAEQREIPADVKMLKGIEEAITNQYRSLNCNSKIMGSRVQSVNDRNAIVVEVETQVPGLASPAREKQIFFPGGGRTYVITCTALANSAPQHVAALDAILASFRAPAPAGNRGNSTGTPPDPLAIAAFGAIAGPVVICVLAYLQRWMGRK
jgi:hypothetical protein